MIIESPQKSADFGQAAMERMAAEGIAASPENYSVWFAYYSGKNPALIRAIDVLDSNGQAFNEAISGELYDKYVGADPTRQAINEIGERIQSSLESVIAEIEKSSAGANAYGQKLAHVSTSLHSGEVGMDQLQALVGAIFADTKAMVDQNSALEEKLKRTSEQMESTRRELEIAQREAMTDGLTGIPNRKYFDLQLKQAVVDTMETGDPLALLMLDIDHFKKFNDDHGHQIGDEVIKLVARVLQTSIKGQDIAARYGGEEFSIILPNTPHRQAQLTQADRKHHPVRGGRRLHARRGHFESGEAGRRGALSRQAGGPQPRDRRHCRPARRRYRLSPITRARPASAGRCLRAGREPIRSVRRNQATRRSGAPDSSPAR